MFFKFVKSTKCVQNSKKCMNMNWNLIDNVHKKVLKELQEKKIITKNYFCK